MAEVSPREEVHSQPEYEQKGIIQPQTNPEQEIKPVHEVGDKCTPAILSKEQPVGEEDYCDANVKAYFHSKITTNDRNKSMAVNLLNQKVDQLKFGIKKGSVAFSGESRTVDDIIKSTHPAIAREEEKLSQYINEKNELQKELRRMEEAIENASKLPESPNSHSPRRKGQPVGSTLSPEQHQHFIHRITAIKKQIQQRKKLHAQYEQNRMKELQKKEEQSLRQKQEQFLSEKRNQVKQRLELIAKRRQKMKQEEKEAKKRFKSVSQQKRLHQKMQEEYHKSVLLPIIEERNKILEERSKQLREVKIEDILEYEKKYQREKQERQQNSRHKANPNWDYKHPAYSSKMMKILEEERIAEKIKQEEEKRKIQELKSRQESYKQYLRERFSYLKIDEKKKLEISTLISKENAKKQPVSEASMREIGNKYLSEAKSKIKSSQKDKKESLSTNEQTAKKTKMRESYKIKPSTSMSNYESSSSSEIRTNKIDQILSSRSISEHEKLKKLQFEIEKLSEKAQRKELMNKHTKRERQADQEDLDNLLSSIKAKMSFIELYQK